MRWSHLPQPSRQLHCFKCKSWPPFCDLQPTKPTRFAFTPESGGKKHTIITKSVRLLFWRTQNGSLGSVMLPPRMTLCAVHTPVVVLLSSHLLLFVVLLISTLGFQCCQISMVELCLCPIFSTDSFDDICAMDASLTPMIKWYHTVHPHQPHLQLHTSVYTSICTLLCCKLLLIFLHPPPMLPYTAFMFLHLPRSLHLFGRSLKEGASCLGWSVKLVIKR